jgi:hypothetical protein
MANRSPLRPPRRVCSSPGSAAPASGRPESGGGNSPAASSHTAPGESQRSTGYTNASTVAEGLRAGT